MEIENLFDLMILTIYFVVGGVGIGLFGATYLVYLGFRRGLIVSYRELIDDNPRMTNLQKVLAGMILFLATFWFLFIKGEFFRYLNGVERFFS